MIEAHSRPAFRSAQLLLASEPGGHGVVELKHHLVHRDVLRPQVSELVGRFSGKQLYDFPQLSQQLLFANPGRVGLESGRAVCGFAIRIAGEEGSEELGLMIALSRQERALLGAEQTRKFRP